jgi:hypothetical protein
MRGGAAAESGETKGGPSASRAVGPSLVRAVPGITSGTGGQSVYRTTVSFCVVVVPAARRRRK